MTFLRMAQGLAVDRGCTMCTTQVAAPHLWLGLSTLKEADKWRLLDHPMSESSFLDIHLMVERLEFATKMSSQLAQHLRPHQDSRAPQRRFQQQRTRSSPCCSPSYSSPHSDQTITRGRPRDGITTNLATAPARYIIKEPASTPSLDNSAMRLLIVGQDATAAVSKALTAPFVPTATVAVSRPGPGLPDVSSATSVSDSDTVRHAAARDLKLYLAEQAVKPLTSTGWR